MFYLYGGEQFQSTPPNSKLPIEKSGVLVNKHSFLLLDYGDNEFAYISKVVRVGRMTFGCVLYLEDARHININMQSLINTVFPPRPLEDVSHGYTDEREFIREFYERPEPFPDGTGDMIKNILIGRNQGVLDEEYFTFSSPLTSDVAIQLSDGLYSGLRIFGISTKDIPPLIEDHVITWDLRKLFPELVAETPDQRFVFRHNRKLLYVQNVHRTPIEGCLGVDLIYNFFEEQRLVFVQYKCTNEKGVLYHRGDANIEREMAKMKAVPGVSDCHNYRESSVKQARLCRCPVFVKVCERRIPNHHKISNGSYYPACVFEHGRNTWAGIKIEYQPHLTNEHFQELVRSGFIGSTREQSRAINDYLVAETEDDRLKLLFTEMRA